MVSVEVNMLTLAVLLGIFQLLLATQLETQQRGLRWNLSNRDENPPPLTGLAGRVKRAHQNFLETFPFFVGAVAVVQMAGLGDNLSSSGAILYLVSRVAYLGVYAVGITVVRSALWMLSLIGLLMVTLSMFF
jgi:uncharacterized MAPEG superfamily protein